MTNAFDDLEDDDDVSSVSSSHFHETRDGEHSSMMDKSISQSIPNEKPPTISQFQNEFGNYTQNESQSYNQTSSLNDTEEDKGRTPSSNQREYGLYQTTGTPYSNKKGGNSTERTIDSPYELPRPINSVFSHALRGEINDCYTLHENYSLNYATPSNHYDSKGKNSYSNNGYIQPYENNVQGKEFDGSGDNDITSEHYNHCYKTSPNGPTESDNNAYKNAEYNSKEQLEVLYSVRMREIQRLTEELQQLHIEKQEEKNQLGRKLALAHAEIERSNLSRNQAQNALGKKIIIKRINLFVHKF